MDDKLTVVEQKQVSFYDDELIAVRADDGHIYVSIRHMCDALGLSRQAQVRRIKRQEVLAEGYKGGAIIAPPSPDGRGGGRQQAGLLRVDLIPLWLTGVSIKAVKEEIRPKLTQFQKESAKVLWAAFQAGQLTMTPSFEELLQKDSPAVNAYKTAAAIVELAKSQVLIEARLDDYGERLEKVESLLGDSGRHVTPEQASQVSQAVKAVALELGKQTKKNEFGAIYGELYRREGITGYKLLPSHRFDAVMQWLTDWYKRLTDGADVPF